MIFSQASENQRWQSRKITLASLKSPDLHKACGDTMTWSRFSKALDKIFFLIFSFVVIVETMAFFLILLQNFSFERKRKWF